MKGSDYQINLSKDDDMSTIMDLSGELTISNANEIHNYLLNKAVNETSISINIREPVNIDLSFLQILFSLIKSRQEQEYETKLNFNLDEGNQRLLKKTGIIDSINNLIK